MTKSILEQSPLSDKQPDVTWPCDSRCRHAVRGRKRERIPVRETWLHSDFLPRAASGIQDLKAEYPEVEALSPAKGIIRAIGLSVMLWCPIIPVIYWVRLSL
jgi:hypothetical protein